MVIGEVVGGSCGYFSGWFSRTKQKNLSYRVWFQYWKNEKSNFDFNIVILDQKGYHQNWNNDDDDIYQKKKKFDYKCGLVCSVV